MKALSLPELIKVLNNPEKQSMDILMFACKQAASFIKGQEAVYKKGAEFAALLTRVAGGSIDLPTVKDTGLSDNSPIREDTPTRPAEEAAVPGGLNLFLLGTRPVPGMKSFPIVDAVRVLRNHSGEVNSAPRMSLMKAKEIIENLSLGDQETFFRTFTLIDEAQDAIKELNSVGIRAELKK